jgi:outer membrane protein OmpA-like peptidoglycan-associated protein
MRALCVPPAFMSGIVFASATLVPVASLARGNSVDEMAQIKADVEECADLKVIPKLPGSIIVSCDKGDSMEVILPLKPDAQGFSRDKSARGHYEFREYQITQSYYQEEQAFENLMRLLPVAGSTVKYSASPSTITARNGDTWILITIKGEYYDVKTVQANEDPWTPVKDVQEISREMGAHNRVAIYGIQFSLDNTAVLEENSKILGEILTYLKRNPAMTFDVESHKMSTSGTAEDDQDITRKRATAVVNWFVAYGIAAERLRAKPLGRNKPITENDTPLEIQRNDRIELAQTAR